MFPRNFQSSISFNFDDVFHSVSYYTPILKLWFHLPHVCCVVLYYFAGLCPFIVTLLILAKFFATLIFNFSFNFFFRRVWDLKSLRVSRVRICNESKCSPIYDFSLRRVAFHFLSILEQTLTFLTTRVRHAYTSINFCFYLLKIEIKYKLQLYWFFTQKFKRSLKLL